MTLTTNKDIFCLKFVKGKMFWKYYGNKFRNKFTQKKLFLKVNDFALHYYLRELSQLKKCFNSLYLN